MWDTLYYSKGYLKFINLESFFTNQLQNDSTPKYRVYHIEIEYGRN